MIKSEAKMRLSAWSMLEIDSMPKIKTEIF